MDRETVQAARKRLDREGRYGPISVDLLRGKILPYRENLVNLLVVEKAGPVSKAEMMRVLAPRGILLVREGEEWKKTVKPRPEDIDRWTHFLHDASNNAVAEDRQVGPPRDLQWIVDPLWLRSHETPSGIQASVSDHGRIFYFFDEGLVGITDERFPDRWSLVCRDAFNGRLLWKRRLASWGWREWSYQRWAGKDWTELRAGRVDVPAANQRRMVVQGDRLYVTLSYDAPLSILDAATGETLEVIEGTENTHEILASDGVVLLYCQGADPEVAERRGEADPTESRLIALDGDQGTFLWDCNTRSIKSLMLAVDPKQRVIFQEGDQLRALELSTGKPLWQVKLKRTNGSTLVARDDFVFIHNNTLLNVYNAETGEFLWEKKSYPIAGWERYDLFYIDGLIWRGVASLDLEKGTFDDPAYTGKSANVMAVGYDPKTGEEVRRVPAPELRSPEHHHRCYRNKATSRYLITGMEGLEFIDLRAESHSQNNWLRGACVYGILPCNGMIYVPPDQCFCHPGAKLLGYTAVKKEMPTTAPVVAEEDRLQRGAAYESVSQGWKPSPGDWPTFRHDARRSGSTPTEVDAEVTPDWRIPLGGELTAPVVADGILYVARKDAHTLFALDADSGEMLWNHIADGRIDSPPTIARGRVFFGTRAGKVISLDAKTGRLAWTFLAAPRELFLGAFDQFESVWPVHGSVLYEQDTIYCTAGRSTYLDGGIHVWGLDPATGSIRHHNVIRGPHPDETGRRDVSFYVTGANSEVLVAEGGHIYMRQKMMTPDLELIETPVLSSKGAQDFGLHLFSTAGLLDDSAYNRTFWMYSKRWPGFQHAYQAPKSGQLLVFDQDRTYAVKYFYRRNVHSGMFFAGTDGYLVFADKNSTEPQIVGEEGASTPVRWLPQSDYLRRPGTEWKLENEAFGLDKMIGYTRAEPPLWKSWVPVRIRAMVKTRDKLFAAGPPDVLDQEDPYAAFEGRKGGVLLALSAEGGKVLSEQELDVPPEFDGLIAAEGKLFVSLQDGSVLCLSGK
jgi:outer membrane protein assembly factor BamB